MAALPTHASGQCSSLVLLQQWTVCKVMRYRLPESRVIRHFFTTVKTLLEA